MRLKSLADPARKKSVLMKGYFLLNASRIALASSMLADMYQTSAPSFFALSISFWVWLS